MPRKLFDRELENLVSQIVEMGNTVDGRIADTIEALRTMDLEKASEIHCSALAFSLYNKYGFNTFPSLQKLV